MLQVNVISKNKTLNARGRIIDVSRPRVMGVLNATPDSFYAGSRHTQIDLALARTEKMLEDGPCIIDVGGYSSRPGAVDISIDEELERVVPIINNIHNRFPEALISVDTFRARVARAGVDAGASIINDVSGGSLDSEMFTAVSELKVPYVLMHMKGTPQTMTQLATYDDLMQELITYFHEKIAALHRLGVTDIIIDPGFGFAKSVDQNFFLLKHLHAFEIFNQPLMIGVSRKSMIWKTLNTDPEGALNGTTVLHTLALMKGAALLRVHDVREAAETIKLVERTDFGSAFNNFNR